MKVDPVPHAEEQKKAKAMSFLEQASVKAAADYEIERAELNARLSLSIHQQLGTRAFEYCSIPNNQEVVTGYPETIAPLVMDSSRLRCATCAIPKETIVSIPRLSSFLCLHSNNCLHSSIVSIPPRLSIPLIMMLKSIVQSLNS